MTAAVTAWVSRDLELFGYAPYVATGMVAGPTAPAVVKRKPASPRGIDAVAPDAAANKEGGQGDMVHGETAPKAMSKAEKEPWWKTHPQKGIRGGALRP